MAGKRIASAERDLHLAMEHLSEAEFYLESCKARIRDASCENPKAYDDIYYSLGETRKVVKYLAELITKARRVTASRACSARKAVEND